MEILNEKDSQKQMILSENLWTVMYRLSWPAIIAMVLYGLNSVFDGAIYRIVTLLLTPIMGLMRALQPVIGINYGAKNNLRVISGFKIFTVGSTLVMLPFWVISMIMPEAVLTLMFPDRIFDAASLLYFRTYMALLLVLPVIFVAMTFYPAINKGKPAAMIGIVRQVVFYVPVMLILPKLFGIQWVYYGTFLIDTVITVWTVVLVKKEFKILRERQEKVITV